MNTILASCFTYGCSQSTAQDLQEMYLSFHLTYSAVLFLRFYPNSECFQSQSVLTFGSKHPARSLKRRKLQLRLLKITDVFDSQKKDLVCQQRSRLFEFCHKHSEVLIIIRLKKNEEVMLFRHTVLMRHSGAGGKGCDWFVRLWPLLMLCEYRIAPWRKLFVLFKIRLSMFGCLFSLAFNRLQPHPSAHAIKRFHQLMRQGEGCDCSLTFLWDLLCLVLAWRSGPGDTRPGESLTILNRIPLSCAHTGRI